MIVNLGWSGGGAAEAGGRRLTESDRQAVADVLRRALDEGRLDLAGFDERVAAAFEAETTTEVEALLAGLPGPARPARRSWLDALFDRVVVNSALITAPRHRILKATWLACTAATVLACGYVLVRHPFWALALWLPAGALLWTLTAVVSRLAGPTFARRQAVLARLGVSLDLLRAAQPAVQEIAVDYPALETHEGAVVRRKSVAQVRVEFDGTRGDGELAPSVREEIIRLLWRSPLYPLTEIRFGGPHPSDGLGAVRLAGDGAAALEHRYGPRPYGPYREDQR